MSYSREDKIKFIITKLRNYRSYSPNKYTSLCESYSPFKLVQSSFSPNQGSQGDDFNTITDAQLDAMLDFLQSDD